MVIHQESISKRFLHCAPIIPLGWLAVYKKEKGFVVSFNREGTEKLKNIISFKKEILPAAKHVKKQIKNWKNFRFLENPHGGKPSALWYGIKKAGGKFA